MEKVIGRIIVVLLTVLSVTGIPSCNRVEIGAGVEMPLIHQRDTIDDSLCGFWECVINTPEQKTVDSKEEYIDSTDFVLLNSDLKIGPMKVKIKGRGNSTWTNSPKKPYALKFYKKVGLAGLPEDKSWVLLANYWDATHIRNSLASFISREYSCLPYAPHYAFVKLTLNEKFKGIYQLGEKIKISEKRVDVGNDGYLLEIDKKSTEEDPRFKLPYLNNFINIKDPDVKINDSDFNYVRDYLTEAEMTLYSDYFLDTNKGYRKYFEVNSIVDWYLINEIAKNIDAAMQTSCYLYFRRGGKVKFGPIWDFDVAFGNYVHGNPEVNDSVNRPDGFCIKDARWFERFFLDPQFVKSVKRRFPS